MTQQAHAFDATLRSEPRLRGRAVPARWFSIKRGIDVALSLVALTLAAPVLLLAAVGIMIVSPGSAIFTQRRVGLGGKTFRMYKLRTMVRGAHLRHAAMLKYSDVDGPVLKVRNDPRLHSLGSFLRRTSIDEIPNFVNVLRGEMSIVGPRPPLPSEVEHYDAFAMRRLTVKPGLTCLWQIGGRSDLSFQEWMRLDNHYIDTWTPLGDLGIILRTIPAVLRMVGAH